MKLTVLGSNSLGNCYLLRDEAGKVLILEAGVQLAKIKEALDFDFSNVVGCLVSHEHGDHAKSANKLSSAGVNVYASAGTLMALAPKLNKDTAFHAIIPRLAAKFVLTPKIPVALGPFTVIPFLVEHDAAEPMGFLIHHKEMGSLLFLTDTARCDFTFSGLNNILIETNFSYYILNQKIAEGLDEYRTRRLLKSHMSLEGATTFLDFQDLGAVNNIVLIHLSDWNSDEQEFVNHVAGRTGKRVFAARAGVEIPFNKTPF